VVKTYTNTTSIKQVRYDEYHQPVVIAPGETVRIIEDATIVDFSRLIVQEVTNVGGFDYVGYAQHGTLVGDPGWAIFRVPTGASTPKLWASKKMRKVWNNYASYTYS